MFYNKCRVYPNLNSIVNITDTTFIVQVDRGPIGRCFATFQSVEHFERWYATLDAHDRTINEVIMSNERKLVLDIDSPQNLHYWHMYNFEMHIRSRIRYVFSMLDIAEPDIIVYDICGDNKLSYHIVVCNLVFSAATCHALCCLISYGQIWEPLVDKAVYKRIQNMRIEGSTKYGQSRWKRATTPAPLHKGLLSVTSGLSDAHLSCIIQHNANQSQIDFPLPHTHNTELIGRCTDFRIRTIRSNTIYLDRIRPGMCVQCNRMHTHENAFITYFNNKRTFMCWRYIHR